MALIRHHSQSVTHVMGDVELDPRPSFGGGIGRADRLSHEQRVLIGPLLPPQHGRGCRPVGHNRPYFEGPLWMAPTGAQ